MIEVVNFQNNDSGNYDFNQGFNPISDFDVNVDQEIDDSRIKPQEHGIYETPTYRRGMTIDLEGELLADDPGDYVSKRKTLVHALFGDNFMGLVSENQMGILSITLTDEIEAWDAAVTVRAFSAPKTWTEGAYSSYLITWFSWKPYFYGHDDDTNFYRWS